MLLAASASRRHAGASCVSGRGANIRAGRTARGPAKRSQGMGVECAHRNPQDLVCCVVLCGVVVCFVCVCVCVYRLGLSCARLIVASRARETCLMVYMLRLRVCVCWSFGLWWSAGAVSPRARAAFRALGRAGGAAGAGCGALLARRCDVRCVNTAPVATHGRRRCRRGADMRCCLLAHVVVFCAKVRSISARWQTLGLQRSPLVAVEARIWWQASANAQMYFGAFLASGGGGGAEPDCGCPVGLGPGRRPSRVGSGRCVRLATDRPALGGVGTRCSARQVAMYEGTQSGSRRRVRRTRSAPIASWRC